MKRNLSVALLACIALQFFVLAGMYILAALPLWFGEEIKVKTIPVDPRSLFRGNYALLNYEFSRLQSTQLPEVDSLRIGEVVYVSLQKNADGLHEYAGISLQRPTGTPFLRGRLTQRRFWQNDNNHFTIKYGIEAFFAPKEKALALEKNLQSGGVALLMVSHNGQARLKDVSGH